MVKYGFGVHMWDLPLWKFSPHFLYVRLKEQPRGKFYSFSLCLKESAV